MIDFIKSHFPVEEHEFRLKQLEITLQEVHRQVALYEAAKKSGTLKKKTI